MLGYESWEASDVTEPAQECGQLGCQQGWLHQVLSRTWAARYNTWLLIEIDERRSLFFFFLFLLSRDQGCDAQHRPVTNCQLELCGHEDGHHLQHKQRHEHACCAYYSGMLTACRLYV